MMKRGILSLSLSIATALAIISLGLILAGYSPLDALRTILQTTWMSPHGIVAVLNKSAILILTGLAVAIPYRAGLFNIGGEGQMLMGAVTAAFLGALPLSFLGPIHLIGCVVGGMLAGSLWGALAGWLKTARGAHEVISTILLNFIAFQLANELALGWLQAAPGASRTAFIHPSAEMPGIAMNLKLSIALSALLALSCSIILHRAWLGFRIQAVGANPEASNYAGIDVKKHQWLALGFGGAFAGLAGALETTGITHAFFARFTMGSGFDGIAIAFLALCEPWGVIPSAMFLATLRAADGALQLDMNLPKEAVFALEGILIICVAVFVKRKHA